MYRNNSKQHFLQHCAAKAKKGKWLRVKNCLHTVVVVVIIVFYLKKILELSFKNFCVILWQVKHSYIYDHHSKIMPERGVKERERTENRAVGRSENSGGKYVVMPLA